MRPPTLYNFHPPGRALWAAPLHDFKGRKIVLLFFLKRKDREKWDREQREKLNH
jgi:hypothetical protein